MSTPYVGEIRMVGFNFAPADWALCNGQLLAISENEALFNLIGTTYGGDGQSTFGLPNLQSRIPFHMGSNASNSLVLGQLSGTETVTLLTNQIPAHSHTLPASSASGTQPSPAGGVWASSTMGGVFGGGARPHNGPEYYCRYGWRPAARQYAAIPGDQFHHRPLRHFSKPGLRPESNRVSPEVICPHRFLGKSRS